MVQWRLSGDYFENCNCDVVCPCLVSKAAPLTARPTRGVCDEALLFHIDRGRYGEVPLDGLNVALVAHAPGPMAEGNWTVAGYVDERADDQQAAALAAIFTGAEGGPMAGMPPARPGPDVSAGGLTPREQEVVALLGAGLSNRDIARKLYISPATAARHVANRAPMIVT